MVTIHSVMQIVSTFLKDVAEDPKRLERATELAEKQITEELTKYVVDQIAQGNVPQGWRVVPDEMTDEMFAAAESECSAPSDDLRNAYIAAIDAAPKPGAM